MLNTGILKGQGHEKMGHLNARGRIHTGPQAPAMDHMVLNFSQFLRLSIFCPLDVKLVSEPPKPQNRK